MFFCHCNTENHIFLYWFHGKFACICFWIILRYRQNLNLGEGIVLGNIHNSLLNICSVLCSVFFSIWTNYQLRLLKFLINECKIQSQKYFRAVCCRVSRFFIFHATSKNKRDTCSDLGVAHINFRPSASTPKYAKRDPFLDADAFGVVRNCHRIRASGNGIFFPYIVW